MNTSLKLECTYFEKYRSNLTEKHQHIVCKNVHFMLFDSYKGTFLKVCHLGLTAELCLLGTKNNRIITINSM